MSSSLFRTGDLDPVPAQVASVINMFMTLKINQAGSVMIYAAKALAKKKYAEASMFATVAAMIAAKNFHVRPELARRIMHASLILSKAAGDRSKAVMQKRKAAMFRRIIGSKLGGFGFLGAAATGAPLPPLNPDLEEAKRLLDKAQIALDMYQPDNAFEYATKAMEAATRVTRLFPIVSSRLIVEAQEILNDIRYKFPSQRSLISEKEAPPPWERGIGTLLALMR